MTAVPETAPASAPAVVVARSVAFYEAFFGVPADIEAARRRMEASSLVRFDEGDTVCCHARQDKVWAADPDGNGWEVYFLLDEISDHEDDDFGTGGISAAGVGCACDAGSDCCN